MKPPRLRLLGRVADLPVYLVSGQQVRDKTDIDFTMGGNEGVYPTYVPAGEIWIDDAAGTPDRMATTLHEIVERELMIHHGWTYDRAHDAASAAERPFRKDLARRPPKTFDAARVTAVYQAWLRQQPGKASTAPRKHGKQLEREIEAAFTGKSR
jgi:hypothetical protein